MAINAKKAPSRPAVIMIPPHQKEFWLNECKDPFLVISTTQDWVLYPAATEKRSKVTPAESTTIRSKSISRDRKSNPSPSQKDQISSMVPRPQLCPSIERMQRLSGDKNCSPTLSHSKESVLVAPPRPVLERLPTPDLPDLDEEEFWGCCGFGECTHEEMVSPTQPPQRLQGQTNGFIAQAELSWSL